MKEFLSSSRIRTIVICAAVPVVVFLLLLLFNRYELLLEIPGPREYSIEYGTAFSPPEAKAVYRGKLLPFSFKVNVQLEKELDPEKLGTQVLVYTATHKKQTVRKEIRLTISDSVSPIIVLRNNPDQKNVPGKPYKEEGYSAYDNHDGDITSKVICSTVDGYRVYVVMDEAGNRAQVMRNISYSDLPPVITIMGGADIIAELGTPFMDPGCRAEDDVDGDVTEKVTVQGAPDMNVVGEYRIVYTVSDSAGQVSEAVRTIRVVDTVPPEIFLVTGSAYTSPSHKYAEEGYWALDNYDGDLTAAVTREEYEDHIVYRVSDSSGNSVEVIRQIVYKDVIPPEIRLAGETVTVLPLGTAYEEAGYAAVDDVDGDITASVTVEGGVNSSVPGVYRIGYRISDAAGNAASVVREIHIVAPQKEDAPAKGKIIYLTFDDGPGDDTGRLLDILDSYGVKATFFVTNQMPHHRTLIGEIARRGHTVAIHTLTHKYSEIYASEEAFWDDIEKMNQVIEEETGKRSSLLRFPGGSSNSVSEKYCEGIMTALTASAAEKGYRYCDWNVSAEDAAGNDTTEGIVELVTSDISGKQEAIVLQHDIIAYSVDAVPAIIAWGLENGYSFQPITESTTLIHQAVTN